MSEELKPLYLLGDTRRFLQRLPETVRRALGFSLFQLQAGNLPRGIQKLKGYSVSVHEIRLRHDNESYRAVFTVAFEDRVYLLHAFHKKSKSGIAIPRQDVETIRKRLKEAERMEAERNG